jgi:type IV pilus assembly protein PilM
MNILSGGQTDFFGLDIGSTALRAVQLHGAGPIKALSRYAQEPIEGNLALSDSKIDQQNLAQVIKNFLSKSGISSKNVASSLPSHRVFTTVIDLDKMAPNELNKAIYYQADSYIPTPPDKSKIDWAVIGDSPKDPNKVEVLLSSVPNEFIEARLDLLESIGLNVVAFEPVSLALTRAILAADATLPQMVLNIGSKSTDIVIAMNGAPHLTRAIPLGSEAIVRAASQSLNVDVSQAQQFVFKFGVSKDKLEGKVYAAIVGTVDSLMAEIEKSIKFFQDRYPSAAIERIIVTGGASVMPELPLYIANKFNMNVEIGNAWRNVSFPSSQQNELLSVSNHFAVAVGLAERTS